ncbi:MAG: helix-turn-helix domain-containing protein [Nitrospirae bacterium YQR-1]
MSRENIINTHTIGDRIKKIRHILNLKQKDMAEILSVGQSLISLIENNSINLTSEHFIILTNKLKININWLLTGEGEILKNETIQKTKNNSEEDIINWIKKFWKDANEDEKSWLKIQFKKCFTEYQDWLNKKEQEDKEKDKQ